MNLCSKVNQALWELETLEGKIRQERSLTSPQFGQESQRLRYEIHRMHWEAYNLDNSMMLAGPRSYYFENQAMELMRQINNLRNEIGFVQAQLARFTHWDKHPPTKSTIFSSPSHSSGPDTPVGAGTSGYSSVFWHSPQKLTASQEKVNRRHSKWSCTQNRK